MNYNKKRHKQLVILSQDVKNQGKNLFIENPKEYSELLKYNIAVEEQVFWTHREQFLILMKNLINNSLHFDEFETAFSVLYRKITKEFHMFIIDLKQIEKFQPSTRSYRFASSISSIFRQFEEIEDEYSTKQEVKDSVRDILQKIEPYL